MVELYDQPPYLAPFLASIIERLGLNPAEVIRGGVHVSVSDHYGERARVEVHCALPADEVIKLLEAAKAATS